MCYLLIPTINSEISIPFIVRFVTDLTENFVETLTFIFAEYLLLRLVKFAFINFIDALADLPDEKEEDESDIHD